jgi:hypothetical protein
MKMVCEVCRIDYNVKAPYKVIFSPGSFKDGKCAICKKDINVYTDGYEVVPDEYKL